MENSKQPDVHTAAAFINKLVGAVVLEHRNDLIALLRKHGVDISPDVSDTDLITITYMGFAKSQKFKHDFINYTKTHHSVNNNLNYVDEDFFGFLGITIGKKAKAKKAASKAAVAGSTPSPSPTPDAESKTKGSSALGQLLGSVATPENLNVLLNTGLGLVSSKLTAKADQKSIQAATALEVQKTQTAIAEAAAAKEKTQTKKWVTPVIIGVSLLVVGVVIYFIAKKKR